MKTQMVALYIRTKNLPPTEMAFSLDVQRINMENYCQRRGWDVVAVYRDEGMYSALDTNRPGLQQLLADARTGAFDVVMAHSSSRISRNIATFAAILCTLHNGGISFVTCYDGIDTTKWGKFTNWTFRNLTRSFVDGGGLTRSKIVLGQRL